jgi:hypothetical protein
MNAQFARWCLMRMALAVKARHAMSYTAKQDDSTSKTEVELARGASTVLPFIPSAPGYIHATATWHAVGDPVKPLALKMQLIRPDGSVAADAIGCNPLALHFHLRRNEFKRNQGKAYRVVLMHTVATLGGEVAKGELRATWGDGGADETPAPPM